MRIYLTGFMGAGKSKVGRSLADTLDLPLLDLDTEVEATAGKTVREIFAEDGEAVFRDLEHRCLVATEKHAAAVVATGGGTIVAPRNLALLRRLGVSVWLDPSFETIVGRMSAAGRAKRPLFADEDRARELYALRLSAYAEADLRIEIAPSETAGDVAARIAHRLSENRVSSSFEA